MHLLIIRHGQCLGQCDPTYSSDPDSPLSPHGEHQAHQLAQRLCGEQLTHILSSPLVRSLLTASIIADVMGISVLTSGLSYGKAGTIAIVDLAVRCCNDDSREQYYHQHDGGRLGSWRRYEL